MRGGGWGENWEQMKAFMLLPVTLRLLPLALPSILRLATSLMLLRHLLAWLWTACILASNKGN